MILKLYKDNAMLVRVLVEDADGVPTFPDTITATLLDASDVVVVPAAAMTLVPGQALYNYELVFAADIPVTIGAKYTCQIDVTRGTFVNRASTQAICKRYKGE